MIAGFGKIGLLLTAVALVACDRTGLGELEARRLPSALAEECGRTEYRVVPMVGDPAHLDDTPERLVAPLNFPGVFYEAHGPLATSTALVLCALAEGPLVPGDSVIRFVRQPPWESLGRTYSIRLEARGRHAILAARILALCRHDSLWRNAPREFDDASGDTVIRIPDLLPPGNIDYGEVRLVARSLFDELVGSLEERGFWDWEEPVPSPDGYRSFLEVQLGDRYRKHEIDAVTGGVPLRLISETALAEVACPDEDAAVPVGWLKDERPLRRR